MAPKKYPYIYAWGEYMGSNLSYTRDQARRAEAVGMPASTIYIDSEGEPITVDRIKLGETRDIIERLVVKYQN